jgi:hypothetical protein
MAGWIADRAFIPAAAATAALVIGLPGAVVQIHGNVVGRPQSEGSAFAQAPQMWAAMRAHAGAAERVGNSPLVFGDMTLWPVNISWALLADRRSCFAGRELALAYASLPRERVEGLEAQFVRVFAGNATDDDIKDLASRYGCQVILVTPRDAAWNHDPFAASPLYRLVEEKPDSWRIYRAREGG